MNFKRLFYYLILNIVVSAVTILIVLNIWDRMNNMETVTPEPVSVLPTIIASAIPPTATPTPKPTLALRPYEVGPGETLGEIALLFNTNVDQLLEINSLADPDELVVGMVLLVPLSGTTAEDSSSETQSESAPSIEPDVTLTPLPTPESSLIKIVTIVGIDDLATEHLQIQSVSPEALSLEGWRLETKGGLVYTFPKITLFEYGAVDLYTRAGINSVVALYWGRSTPVFQSGDQALIYDAEGNLQAVYNIPERESEIMSELPRSIDEQIRQAMQRGEFDNLPGKGKPLNLSENPHEDPGWRMAYRMLKENGYTLPWIETRRNIELDYERAIKTLQQSWTWRKDATGRRGLMHAEREWQQALQAFRVEITKINKRIRDYNLETPSNQFQRRAINVEQEIEAITQSTD